MLSQQLNSRLIETAATVPTTVKQDRASLNY
jgi:hypothetical protein